MSELQGPPRFALFQAERRGTGTAERDIAAVTRLIRCGFEMGRDTIRLSAGGP